MKPKEDRTDTVVLVNNIKHHPEPRQKMTSTLCSGTVEISKKVRVEIRRHKAHQEMKRCFGYGRIFFFCHIFL